MVKARHHGADYVFALLTGYRDPPAGIKMREGLHYNPYFPGGAIAMAKALNDGGMDFEDGTPATESQMAKDVTSFLCWAAEPEHDTRKKMGVQFMTAVAFMIAITAYHKRLKWNVIKTRRITYKL
jgi:ubiquinol-cytochrome c reductase cytochrome c1 subunit